MQHLVIDRRFRGPPDSGNGGYVCGWLGSRLGVEAEVTLRRPPPLERPLAVRAGDDGTLALLDDDACVAEARVPVPALLADPEALAVPRAVSHDEAVECAQRYSGFDFHPFPGCFVCGPERAEGDGLRIFPGPTHDAERLARLHAAPWTPDPSLVDPGGADGLVAAEHVWAALDCPGAFPLGLRPGQVCVLGRLAVRVEHRPAVGEPCVVVGWLAGVDGRKHFAGTALFDASGRRCGVARATWIQIE